MARILPPVRRRPSLAHRLALGALALALAGCASTTSPSPSGPAGTASTLPSNEPSSGQASASVPASASPPARPTTKPTARPSAPPSATASCVSRTLASLDEAQRIGQLFILGLANDELTAAERTAIASYHFGSMTFTVTTHGGVAGVRVVTSAVQGLATSAATGRIGFFVAGNQEGGHIQGFQGPGFDTIPTALAQGALSPSTLKADASRWGRQLAAAGVNLDFAPVADTVPAGTDQQNAPIGQLAREYGHDPATVASHVTAFISGMRSAGVATTAKHFPGLGRVAGNTDDTGDVVDTVTTADDPYLAPFKAAIAAGTPFVMVSLATYTKIDPDHLAAFSPTIVGSLLRGTLGFRGVVVSDGLTAEAVSSIPPATRATDFIAAGGDMLISNFVTPAEQMAAGIAARASSDAAFRGLVDAAVTRVLEAKQAAGLLPCD
ncbi:MAG TPA: glycoside hydrolase family 3 N-terminal domain-containing protein [Candidatus Binatia bacterium]|nr:glycoside hydrolase family 3 N-terminal domain-containing protein [Candidatus Binatia bacterium]